MVNLILFLKYVHYPFMIKVYNEKKITSKWGWCCPMLLPTEARLMTAKYPPHEEWDLLSSLPRLQLCHHLRHDATSLPSRVRMSARSCWIARKIMFIFCYRRVCCPRRRIISFPKCATSLLCPRGARPHCQTTHKMGFLQQRGRGYIFQKGLNWEMLKSGPWIWKARVLLGPQ